jgi:hypothetical protein
LKFRRAQSLGPDFLWLFAWTFEIDLSDTDAMQTTMTWPNKSLQATRDGGSSSAIAEDIIRPARLSSGR